MTFKKGDKVEVINVKSHYYKKIGLIHFPIVSNCTYLVDFNDDYVPFDRDDLILVASSQNVTNKVKGSSIYLDKLTLPTTIREDDITVNIVNIDSNCSHKWKLYNGFTESYEYCELCDKKRGA